MDNYLAILAGRPSEFCLVHWMPFRCDPGNSKGHLVVPALSPWRRYLRTVLKMLLDLLIKCLPLPFHNIRPALFLRFGKYT